jgi:hypothetical protein
VWCVGLKKEGQQSNQFNHRKGFTSDREGNVDVADCENDRIQVFETELNQHSWY